MPRHLTAEQIDRALALLLAKNGEYVSRGRGGSGFGHRDGVLYRVSVEENDREEYELSESDLRAALAAMDLDDYTGRYDIWALQELGVEVEGPTLVSKA